VGEIPHEKELVELYHDQPFAILGINTDDDADEYRKKRKEMGVTWTCIFNGSTRGGVPEAYGVQGYPTSYLLDAEGRIRYKDLRGSKLKQKVAELMAEMKAGK